MPVVLHGVVGYGDVVQALHGQALPPADRKRFQDRREDWERLFSVHPRLTLAEIRLATRLDDAQLEHGIAHHGIVKEGVLYSWPEDHPPVEPPPSPSPICPSFSETDRSPPGSDAGNLPPG